MYFNEKLTRRLKANSTAAMHDLRSLAFFPLHHARLLIQLAKHPSALQLPDDAALYRGRQLIGAAFMTIDVSASLHHEILRVFLVIANLTEKRRISMRGAEKSSKHDNLQSISFR